MEARRAGLPDRLEIKPSRRNMIRLALLIAAFVAGGVWLVLMGGVLAVVAGTSSILFFGVFGTRMVLRTLRGEWRIVLTPDAFVNEAGGIVFVVPWQAIETIETFEHRGARFIGLRLDDYRFLEQTPGLGDAGARIVRLARWTLGRKTASFIARGHLPEGLEGTQDPLGLATLNSPGARASGGLLAWSRKTLGYDLAISPMTLDRSTEDMLETLRHYHSAAR